MLVDLDDYILTELHSILNHFGAYREDLSPKQVLEKALSCLLHGTADLYQGRKAKSKTLATMDPELAAKANIDGMVASWLQQVDIKSLRHRKASDQLTGALTRAYREVQQREAAELKKDMEDPILAKPKQEAPRQLARSSTPPWEDMPKESWDRIEQYYPGHPLLEWAGECPLKQLAVSSTFATVPKALHLSQKMMDLAEELYEEFKEWEERKEEG